MHYFIILFFIGIFSSYSQTAVGDIKVRTDYGFSKINNKGFDKLKGAKTFFVRPKQFTNDYSIEEYQNVFDKVWTVSPVTVINHDELNQNVEVGNLIIRFKSYTRNVQGKGIAYGFNYFKFGLVDKKKVKDDGNFKWWEDFNAVISFTANATARVDMNIGKDTINGDLLDYRLGYLKNYIQQINDAIENQKNYEFYKDLENKAELRKLRNAPLLVPENIIYRFNALTGRERDRSTDDLFENYSYNFEVIEESELNEKILNEQDSFYYLMYHQTNSNKIITIVNGVSGEIIYRTSKNMSYNMKPKDIKALSKTISKS